MSESRAFKNRLFLYIGLILILLSVAIFPIQANLEAEPGDIDAIGVGWLFSPVIGIWGLTSLAIGIFASSLSRTKTVLSILPVFVLIYGGLAFTIWMVLLYGSVIFWWGYFSLFLIPGIIASTVSILYLLKKERLFNALSNSKIIIAISCCIVLIPLLYSLVLWMALF